MQTDRQTVDIPKSTKGRKKIRLEIVDNSANINIGENCKIDNLYIYAAKQSKIIIEDNCQISGELRCGFKSTIIVHKNTTFASNVHMTAYENTSILIDEDCMFSHNVIIRTSDGHYIFDEQNNRINPSKSIKIGKHVWVSMNTTILKGVTIGDGAVIGIGSIVTHDIDSCCIAAGIPAKIIKKNIHWKR